MNTWFSGKYLFIIAFLGLISLNLLVLDGYIIQSLAQKQTDTPPFAPEKNIDLNILAKNSPSPITKSVDNKNGNNVPLTDLDIDLKIQNATASLTRQIEAISTSQQSNTTTSQQSITGSSSREFYIPLGSGSTTATVWTDLAGIEAAVNPTNYDTITAIYFEAVLRVPSGGGSSYARLLNVSDTIGLFESEVSYEGTNGKLITSAKIPIPTSTKLYRVQLRSAYGSQVILDSARIKIFTQ